MPRNTNGYKVSQLLDDYMKDFELRGGRSARSARCDVKKLASHFGEWNADAVTTRVLKDYQVGRRAQGKANGTINREMAIFRAAYRVGLENEVIRAAPHFPRKLTPGEPRHGYFERDGYEAIRSHLPDWARDIFDYAYHAGGWRKGEIIGLTWDEIDLDAGEVRLARVRSKNGRPRLPVPIVREVRAIIERRVDAMLPGCRLVFHRDGHRVSDGAWYRVWKEARVAAGLPSANLHDTRRSMSRDLIRSGNAKDIAKGVTGHLSDYIFSQYNVTVPEDIRVAYAKLREYRDLRAAERKATNLFPRREEKT